MKSEPTKPSHLTHGNVFDDLGFSPEKALQLKVKSDLFLAIRRHIEAAGHIQRDLCRILGEHQPQVSNLVNGRISKISIEKLLGYASRLGLNATVRIRPASTAAKPKRTPTKKLAA
ncbi:MAG: transcriptional regulator, family [Acidobacteriaceae bacterium]|nr:transcriptional regulator, family [Acidobacteriaceae bacterium]